MTKKNWLNPELNELGLESTKEELCYCENGTDTLHGGGHGGNGGGHHHRPPHEGGGCPDNPKPNPNPDFSPGFGPAGSVTPALS